MTRQLRCSNDGIVTLQRAHFSQTIVDTSVLGIPSSFVIRALSFSLIVIAFSTGAWAQSITRAEALRIAESYIQHQWHGAARNVLHGKDEKGIEVNTPDRQGGRGTPLDECWQVNEENTGVA